MMLIYISLIPLKIKFRNGKLVIDNFFFVRYSFSYLIASEKKFILVNVNKRN